MIKNERERKYWEKKWERKTERNEKIQNEWT